MEIAALLSELARECPNGISFDPMAVRLLRQKVPFEDCQIEKLKSEMFQLKNGLWFSREMIVDDESQVAILTQSMKWLVKYGYFSVQRLFEMLSGLFQHINISEDCAFFLKNLGFTVSERGKGGYFCSQPSLNLDESLAVTSKTIAGWLDDTNGTLPFHEIKQKLPHLSFQALESIREQFLSEIFVVEIGAISCWCSAEAIPLPEDFSEKVSTAIDTLVVLGKRLSAANIEFALNLYYRTHFRKDYALLDNATFMGICANHYKGQNKFNKPRASLNPDRSRRKPTRFSNLGVPIGAKLTFIKDNNITCNVLDGSNQVEYEGESWAISTLAIHLLGSASVNGFLYFRYKDETLWDRRLRLEQQINSTNTN